MHPRQIIFLAVLLAALAGAVVFQKMQTSPNAGFEITRPLNIDFKKEEIREVLLQHLDDGLKIARQDAHWVIASEWNTLAGGERVDALLNQLAGLQGEVRSTEESLLADYGLRDGEAVRVELRGSGKDKAQAELLVGTRGLETGTAFVRRPGSSEVFAVDRPLLDQLGFRAQGETGIEREAGFWNDLRLFREDTSLIQKIAFKRETFSPGASFSIAKKEVKDGENMKTLWTFEGGESAFEPDERKIEDLLQLLAGARALKTLDPSKDYGFGRPIVEVTLTLKEGDPVVYRLAASEGETKSYYLKSSSDPAVFEVSLYHVKRLDLFRRHFFLNNPLGIEAAEVREVLLRKGAQEWFAGQTEDKKAALSRIAAVLAGLEEEIRELKSPPAWTEPSASLEAKAGEDKGWVFHFGPSSAGRVPFRLSGEARTFDLPEKTFQVLFQDFPAAAAPAAEAPGA